MKEKIWFWFKNNWFLCVILILGAFLRLYKIDQYMTFLGDEGRDAIIVRRLLVYFDPILIGPGTSIGGMYLGPLYYYLIAPSLLLANFSPVGPSIFIALVGILTIYFVYHVANKFFSKDVGIIAAMLYAVSPVVIIYSRSSWNPNIMPFFALLSVYSIWKVWKENKYVWMVLLGISSAFILQSHYLGLLLFPTLFVFWVLAFYKVWNDKVKKSLMIRYSLLAASIFILLMSPLAIFDFRHNFLNSKAIYKFFTVRQETVSVLPWKSVTKIYPIFQDINVSLLSAKNIQVGKLITIFTILLVSFTLLFRKHIDSRKEFHLLTIWVVFALIGLGLYKQNIYDHYYGFIFPAIFILFAFITTRINKIFAYIVTLLLVLLNLMNTPLNKPANMQMQRSEMVANKIKEETKGERFNLAVIAERNYEDGYQYFLEKSNQPVVDIDSQIQESVTNQLFVVCEMPKEKCDPTHSAKAEVANFGWSKIENTWEVFGVTIYKLIHTK